MKIKSPKRTSTTFDLVTSDEVHWQMSIPERYVFIDLLKKIRPKLAIEVGTRFGGSLRIISMYSKKVFALDIDPSVQTNVEPMKNVSFICGNSRITLPKLLHQVSSENIPLEFILIDADHSFEGVRQDIISLLDYTPVRPLYFLLHDSFNPDCRRGIMSVDWSQSQYIHSLELDYVPGLLLSSQKHFNQMWGGLALGRMCPYPRVGNLEIQARAELSFQASFNSSMHKSGQSSKL